jgi:hypothetical protein
MLDEIKPYCGMDIEALGFYDIDPTRISQWQNDAGVLSAILSSAGKMSDGTNTFDDPVSGLNFLKDTYAVDSENATISRLKINTAGWYFHDRYLQLITSKLDSLCNFNAYGIQIGDAVIKFYDVEDAELLTQESIDLYCVKTVIDIEPIYDYEIISASVFSVEKTLVPVYVGVIIIPDISIENGGSKCTLNGADFSQSNKYEIDGRTVKRLNYNATYHTNKIRGIILHPTGLQLKLNIDIDHFKA